MSTPTTVQSNLIPLAISTDGSTYYNIVCKKAWNFNGDTTTTSDESDCGVHTGLGANKWTFDFTALMNITPDADQKSAKDLLAYWAAQTLLYIKALYPTSTGANMYVQGQAYLTSFKLTNQVGSLQEFSGTFTGTNDIDVTP